MFVLLTPAAVRHIHRVLPQGTHLRLSLRRTGCAGVTHHLEQAGPQSGDIAVPYEGFNVYVAAADAQLLGGTVIDVMGDAGGQRVVFHNPREESRCGCGQSINLRS